MALLFASERPAQALVAPPIVNPITLPFSFGTATAANGAIVVGEGAAVAATGPVILAVGVGYLLYREYKWLSDTGVPPNTLRTTLQFGCRVRTDIYNNSTGAGPRNEWQTSGVAGFPTVQTPIPAYYVDAGGTASGLCPANMVMTDLWLKHSNVNTFDPWDRKDYEWHMTEAAKAAIAGDPSATVDLYVGSNPCNVAANPCYGWSDGQTQLGGQTMQCRYGSTVLPLADCGAYEEPLSHPGRTNTTTGDRDASYTEPQPSQQPSGRPSPGSPGSLGDPSDSTVPTEAPSSDGNSCFPTGWGLLNPIEWVFKPTVCALRWAFIPDQATLDRLTTLRTDMAGRQPFVFFGQAQAFTTDLVPDVGAGWCWDVALPMDAGTDSVICAQSGDTIYDWFQGKRAILAVALYLMLFAPLAVWAWKAYAPAVND